MCVLEGVYRYPVETSVLGSVHVWHCAHAHTDQVKEQLKNLYRSMHTTAYLKIKDCLEDGSIAEGSLRLPVRIDDLFYNGEHVLVGHTLA